MLTLVDYNATIQLVDISRLTVSNVLAWLIIISINVINQSNRVIRSEEINMVKLADTEWKIMELLWEKGPLSTMEIVHLMEDMNGWTRSTVITLLNRMTNKGSVRFVNSNRTKVYHACIDKSEASLEEARNFLGKFYEGNIGLLLSSMIKQEFISSEELEEIKKIISDNE